MLIRFVAKNIFSFDQETEFNLLPNKTQRLSHHKIRKSNIDFLRFSAIYGANASGKSNLINSIGLLEEIIEDGVLGNNLDKFKFKLNPVNLDVPISLAIELFSRGKIYYYTITFDKNKILNEYLAESNKDKDILIFERNLNGDDNQIITFFPEYTENEKNKLFVDILADKLIEKNELLLSFLSKKYEEEFEDVKNVFDWFQNKLVIIKPNAKPGGLAHILDSKSHIKDFANELILNLNTGITKIDIQKKKIEEFATNDELKSLEKIKDELINNPNSLSSLVNSETGEEISMVYKNDEIITKKLITSHLNNLNENIEFSITEESDGTKRLIEYILAFEGVINEDKVFLIDEIERSIHPIMIKEIISKISLDEKTKGQLIFTTHESNLLDQEILRPDEIWFAQKDFDGTSKLYSLSEFKIHNTVDIQNGYLNGRYGGIPFLSNLKDLNWNKYEVSK